MVIRNVARLQKASKGIQWSFGTHQNIATTFRTRPVCNSSNHFGGVMVRVRQIVGLIPGRVKPKTKIGICCSSTKHAALRSKSKDWLARNQNNVFEWSDMSTCGLVSVSQHYKNPTQHIGLVQSGPHHHLFSLKINLFSPLYS